MSPLPPILASIVLVVAAQVVLKLGVDSLTRIDSDESVGAMRLALRALRVPGVLIGLGLYAASAAFWLFVLATTPLSYAYPFLGLAYVGVAIASVTVLRERVGVVQWIGLALVVSGVMAVAVSR